MKCNSLKKWLTLIGCIVLIAASALTATGCGSKDTAADEKTFLFTVVDLEGNETEFEVHTQEATVGAALIKEGLIEGEEGPYGLYVKVVNGITAIYEEDGSYWAFFENGEYALAGVDQTEIDPDVHYSFVQTKE